jgi:hypothetical protein
MLSYPELTLLHRHGDDWLPMEEVKHTSVEHDPERRMLRGERIFRCEQCADEVMVGGAPDEV